jgi:hypothetical protein
MAMDMAVALRITAGVTGQQAIDQLKTGMERLQGAADKAGTAFAGLRASFGALAATAGVASLGRLVTGAIDAAANLADLSIKTGVSVEQLSRFNTVAKLSGTDMESIADTMKKLSNNAVDAATGNEQLAKIFKALGVDVRDASGQIIRADDLLIKLAQSIDGLDPVLISKVMTELGGKSATNLLPFLTELNQRLDETKSKISTEFAAAAKEYQDNMVLLGSATGALGRAIANDLMPYMLRLTDALLQIKKDGGGIFDQIFGAGRQVVIEMGTDFKNVDASIEKVQGRLTRLRELFADLTKDTLANKLNQAIFGDVTDVRMQIAVAEEELRQLLVIKKRAEDAARPAPGIDATKSGLVEAAIGKPAEPDREALRMAEARLQMLGRLEDEITKLTLGEKALLLLQGDRLGMTDEELKSLGRLFDQRQALAQQQEAEKQREQDLARLTQDALRREQQRMDEAKRLYTETRTPAEALNIELAKLNEMLQQGYIDWDTYSRAVFKAQDRFEEASDKMKDAGKGLFDDLQSAIEGWGKSSADAIAGFVTGAQSSFKSMANSIIQDLIRMAVYRTITQPLFGAIGGMFGGGGPGFGAIPGFANGGVMSLSGEMPLKRYARGGVASSPQIAMFGEGSMPEAYVPLPDGRSIPVTMQGGGGDVVVNVNVESGSTTVQSNDGAGQLGRIIAGVVKSELINQKRPGGLLAG